MPQPTPLPDDLEMFRDSYKEMFGEVPPLPTAKFAFSGEIDPAALRLAEQFRAHAFSNTVFDAKATQLLLFGMLLATGSPAAHHHAHAARRAGASWEELHQVVELASVVSALGPFNQGSAMLHTLRGQGET